MNNKEIQNLIKLINESNVSEFRLKDGDFKLTIRTKDYHKLSNVSQMPMVVASQSSPVQETPSTVQAPASVTPVQEASGGTVADEPKNDLLEIKSPIVGTFYRASGPDKEAFVKVGDTISNDTVVCIVEAMKLFNEIEAEVSGKIVDVLVEDATPIEYDQVLFLVDPKG